MSEWHNVSIIVCSFLMGLLGILSLKQNFKNTSHRLFSATALMSILWMYTLFSGFSYAHPETHAISNTFFRLAHGAGLGAMTCITAFVVSYPKKIINIPAWIKWSYLISSAVLILISISTGLVYESVIMMDDGSLPDIFGPLFGLFILHTFGSQIFSIIIISLKIKNCSGINCRKLKLVCIGLMAFTISVFMTNGILPIFDIYILQREAPLFAFFFLAPTFYSLYQHRFFNLSFQSLNITRHLLLSLSFLTVSGSVYFTITSLTSSNNFPLIMGLSALLGLGTYLYFSKKYPELVSEAYQYFRSKIIHLEQKIYSCDNYQNLEKELQQTLHVKLNLNNPKLWMIRSKLRNTEIPIYTRDHLSDYFSKNHHDVLVQEEASFEDENKKLSKKLKKIQAKLCFPLYAGQELIGLFTIGAKGDRTFYGEEEIDLLIKLKKHLEICFMNILLESGLKKEKSLMHQNIEVQTKRIRELYNKSKQSLSKQEDYLSLAAHELKNPLHTLMLQLEVSMSEMNEKDQSHQDLKVIEASVEKLHRLTMNLFDSQQYDLDKAVLDISNSNISTLINEIYFEFQPLMKEKQLIFTLDNRVPQNTLLNVDPIKIRQVLHNLLHNAIKFTPAGGKVSLKLHETKLTFQIRISDSGCGIPDHEKEKIFEKFTHGEEHHGLGMGLYLSKKIMELHGGSLDVQDNAGGGSVFVLVLRKAECLRLETRRKKLETRG